MFQMTKAISKHLKKIS